jgi:hypothetical protein
MRSSSSVGSSSKGSAPSSSRRPSLKDASLPALIERLKSTEATVKSLQEENARLIAHSSKENRGKMIDAAALDSLENDSSSSNSIQDGQ